MTETPIVKCADCQAEMPACLVWVQAPFPHTIPADLCARCLFQRFEDEVKLKRLFKLRRMRRTREGDVPMSYLLEFEEQKQKI